MFNPRDQWIPIRHPERLSRVLAHVVEQDFAGSQRRAAFHACDLRWPADELTDDERRVVEATRVQIGRLIALGRSAPERGVFEPTLSLRHVQMVGRLLGQEHFEDFSEIFLPEDVQRSLRQYQSWLGASSGPAVVRVPMGAASDMLSEMATSVLRLHAIRYLRNGFPDLFERLDRLLVEGGHSEERGQLAVNRIVEPLLDHIRTGGIERGLEEMGHDELKRFVRLTVEREAILLNRPPDLERGHNAQARVQLALDACVNAALALVDPRAFMPGKGGPRHEQ